jgi:hypothetical protein
MKLTVKLFTTFLCLVITLSNCTNPGPSSQRQKSPEELRMELKQLEQSRPTDYLIASGNYRENFWGDKFKVNCTITNKASIATYKDAVIRVIYYSKTKTELGSKDYTIYELFSPSSSKTVEMTVDNYQDVNSIGLKVISAVPID